MAKVTLSLMLISIVVLAFALPPTHAIDCITTVQAVLPCQGYLIDGDKKPSRECCRGVARLGGLANKSRSDRRSICKCLKSAAEEFPIDVKKARTITKACNVKVSVPIDPSINCDKI